MCDAAAAPPRGLTPALPAQKIVVCEVVNHAVGIVYRSDHPVTHLTEAGLHAFVLPDAPPVPVDGRRLRMRERQAVAAFERARSSRIPEGMHVKVQLRGTGEMSPATVVRRRPGGFYDLDLGDGGVEERRVPRACIMPQPRPQLPAGTPVHARWRANPRNPLYPGYISRVWSSGTYDVDYNDGDIDIHMPADAVTPRRLQPAAFVVFQRRLVEDKGYYHVRFRPQLFARPFFLHLCPELHTYRQLYRAVWEQLRGRAKPTSPPLSEGERVAAAAGNPTTAPVRNVDEWRGPGVSAPKQQQQQQHQDEEQHEQEEGEREGYEEGAYGDRAEAVSEELRTTGVRARNDAGPAPTAGVASSEGVEVEEVEAAPEEGDSEATPGREAALSWQAGSAGSVSSPIPGEHTSPAAEWGFTLREVDATGTGSPQHWMTASYGEDLPCTDTMMQALQPGATLAVDWEPRVMEEQYSMTVANEVVPHKSVKEAEGEAEQRLSLQRCVQSFVGVERLEGDSEAYCSSCKAFRAQTKKLDLWRAPPVLIVQLKRFQFNRFSRRKLNNYVEFPTRDLDLRAVMAHEAPPVPPPDLTWWRHLGGRMKPASAADHAAHPKAPASPPQPLMSGGSAHQHKHATPARAGLAKAGAPARPLGGAQRGEPVPPRREPRREECEGASEDEQGDASGTGGVDMVAAAHREGRHEPIYDLHGVVNHMGVMGAGARGWRARCPGAVGPILTRQCSPPSLSPHTRHRPLHCVHPGRSIGPVVLVQRLLGELTPHTQCFARCQDSPGRFPPPSFAPPSSPRSIGPWKRRRCRAPLPTSCFMCGRTCTQPVCAICSPEIQRGAPWTSPRSEGSGFLCPPTAVYSRSEWERRISERIRSALGRRHPFVAPH